MSQILADRLRELRISRDSLASKTSLGRQRASEILGGSGATVAELRQICVGLRLPVQIFTESSTRERSSIAPLFRSARDAAEEYDITVERIDLFVRWSLELLPKRESLPSWLDEFDEKERSYPAADRLSKVARILIDPDNVDGPLSDLGSRLNQLEGLVVSPIDYTRYEGVSLVAGNYCFIFVSPRFVGRMLFTLGHEFGHIITDHAEGDFANFEKSKDIGSFGKGRKSEAFVDAFSSCLLLPDTGIGKFLRFLSEQSIMDQDKITDREILYLARFFGVSFDVAGLRLENLGLIPEGLTFALSKHLREIYGSPEKRADLLGISPRKAAPLPRIPPSLAEVILKRLDSGEISIGWVSNIFGYSIGEIFAEQARAS